MNRKVILSKGTSQKLEKLFEYLQSNWSQNIKIDFIKNFDKKLEQIDKYPDSFPKSGLVKGLHKCVLTKQTSMYYQFDEKTINIVALFFSKQNPDILKDEMEGKN
ncbi:MAG: type II toxin-antitoxin system RelE/ParE family toxin [Melioribacteraceae bacterium]|jgi:plasmid stabilization system protein ParE|nr:type II toxin-antitoxin system RelE/ParE family toxin [Melioribacteraceae bacterium]